MGLSDALTEARKRSGYSQEDAANALGVSRAMISYWESGHRQPSHDQLVALAELYDISVTSLTDETPSSPRADVAEMLFRGAPEGLPKQAQESLRDFVGFLDGYRRLATLADFKLHQMTQSPFLTGTSYSSADDARRKAEEVRAYLRLGLGPIGDVDWVCELLGITVYRAELGRDLKRTISGAFFNHDGVGFSILVNLEMTRGRRRFTVAHELAHALFHSDSRYVFSDSKKNRRERFADRFAGEMLMPTEGIRRVMEEHGASHQIEDPAEVVHLQRFFDVSYSTALVRLLQFGSLSKQAYYDFKKVRPLGLARSLGYEISDDEMGQSADEAGTGRFPRKFLRLLRHLVMSGELTDVDAAEEFNLTVDDVKALVDPPTTEWPSEADTDWIEELQEFEDSGIAISSS